MYFYEIFYFCKISFAADNIKRKFFNKIYYDISRNIYFKNNKNNKNILILCRQNNHLYYNFQLIISIASFINIILFHCNEQL